MFVHVSMKQIPALLLPLSHFRLVDETLQRVEKEQEAMEAVLVHMSENGDKESSPDHFNVRYMYLS